MSLVVKRSFIERGIPTLAPEAERRTVIQAGDSMRGHKDDNCTVVISYNVKRFPLGTKRTCEEFVLDHYSFSGSLHITSDIYNIREELKKANEAFGEMDTSLASVSRQIELLREDKASKSNQ